VIRLGRYGHWYVLAGIILIGLLLRGLYLGEIADTADFSSPTADALFHDYWARALVSDDWSPPAELPNPYIDSVPFVRPPGYPYFLAAVYKITGQSYLGARLVQMVLGLVNCWLAFLLGRVLFNRAVGLILAGFGACYWGLIYYEGELHAPVLLVTLSLTFLLVMAQWLERPAIWRALLAGILLGLLALVRPNTLLFVPVAAGWMWWLIRRDGSGVRALVPAVVLIVSAMAVIAPATIRNYLVADDLVLISANGAINLYIGNNDTSDGVTTRIPDLQAWTGESGWSCFSYDKVVQGISESEGRSMKYSEISRYFWKRGLDYITSYPSRFTALNMRRGALFWGPAEVSNNKAIAFEKSNSRVLDPIPGFPVFLALSLLGGGLLLVDRRKTASAPESQLVRASHVGPLTALAGLYILTIFLSFLPFLAAARFRISVVPIVFVFGAYGVYRLGALIGQRAWGRALKILAAGVALFLLSNHSFTEYHSDRSWWHTDRALAYARDGQVNLALKEFDLALEQNPGYVDAHVEKAGLLASVGRRDEALRHYRLVKQHRPERVDVRIGMAACLTLAGQPEQAIRELRQVLAMSPVSAQAHFELGRALGSTGEFVAAEEALRESLRLSPNEAGPTVNLGIVLAQQGKHAEAVEQYETAILLDGANAEARRWLARSLCATDAVAEGIAAAQEALRLNPRDAAPAVDLGKFFFGRQQMSEAAIWFRRALQITPNNAIVHSDLAIVLVNLERYEEAVTELETASRLAPRNGQIRQRLQAARELVQNQKRGGG